MLLRLAAPDERYAAVRLCSDLPLPEAGYARHNGEWRLELALPPVARLEYELEVVDHDGETERVRDPGNPHQAPGAGSARRSTSASGARRTPARASRCRCSSSTTGRSTTGSRG